MIERDSDLKGQCTVYEAMQNSLFDCVINMLFVMSCQATNHVILLTINLVIFLGPI